MRLRHLLDLSAAALIVACSGGPRPGDPTYAYNVSGAYAGRLVVGDERFDARLDLDTNRSGTVRGTFHVGAPFAVEGRVGGAVVDGLLRLTISYESDARSRCEARIEGILSVESGGSAIEGPVTVYDCEGELAGHMSVRR